MIHVDRVDGLTNHNHETVQQFALAANIAIITGTVRLMQTLVGEALDSLRGRTGSETIHACADAARAIDNLEHCLRDEARDAFAAAAGSAQDKAFSQFIKQCKTKEVATMQNGISIDELNRAVERESKCARFRETHKPARCTQCGAEIMPGEEIWTIAADNCVFCDSECLAHYVLGYSLDIDCEGYSAYFDDMQGD